MAELRTEQKVRRLALPLTIGRVLLGLGEDGLQNALRGQGRARGAQIPILRRRPHKSERPHKILAEGRGHTSFKHGPIRGVAPHMLWPRQLDRVRAFHDKRLALGHFVEPALQTLDVAAQGRQVRLDRVEASTVLRPTLRSHCKSGKASRHSPAVGPGQAKQAATGRRRVARPRRHPRAPAP